MMIQRARAICHFFAPIVLLDALTGCVLDAEPPDDTGRVEESVDDSSAHEQSTAQGNTASVGQSVHLASLGFGPILDFTGDGFADIADHHVESGQVWIRAGFGNGSFDPPGDHDWGSDVTAAGGAIWHTVTGDFTGDGFADYADRVRSNGQFFVHENRRTGGSDAFDNRDWTFIVTTPDGDWEVLAGRMDGDRFADIIEHNRRDGRLFIRLNGGFAGNGFSHAVFPGFRTTFGDQWRMHIADFDGDHLDDVADYHIPSGQFWIHRNLYRTLGRVEFDSVGQFRICPSAARTCMFGDYSGDWIADLADLDVSTGFFQVWRWIPITFFPWGAGGRYSPGFNVMGLPIHIAP